MSYYFTNDETIRHDTKRHSCKIKNQDFIFETDNGVFSKKGLDFGTRTLLEMIDLESIKGNVLDFGCGYGPIGIFIKKNCSVKVDMIDVNKRSVNLAKTNASLNQVDVNIFESDFYDKVTEKYDFIISNPPIRIGKAGLYKILFEAKNYLKENGKLIIVINKDQGAKSVARDLKCEYQVTVLGKNKGFYVICAQNN